MTLAEAKLSIIILDNIYSSGFTYDRKTFIEQAREEDIGEKAV